MQPRSKTAPKAISAMETPAAPEQIAFRLWQNLRARLVWIYEGRPVNTQGHANRASFTVWHLREGQLTIRSGDAAELQAGRGSWLLLPPGRDERTFSADARILSVSFEARWVTGENWLALDAPLLLRPEQTTGWYRSALPMLKIVRRDFAHAYNSLPATPATFGQYASLQGHFLNWLNALAHAAHACGVRTRPLLVQDERALHIRDYLETCPLEHALRVERLAEVFHLSVSQLNRIFYAHFGTSPRAHFESLRHERALTLLRQSDAPIKEIAFSLGFRHTSQLSSWFRAREGCSPLQYRRSAVSAVGAG